MSQWASIHSDHVEQQLYHDSYISGPQYLVYGDGYALFQEIAIHINNFELRIEIVIVLKK